MLRLPLRLKMYAGESWVGYRKGTAKSMRMKWRKMGPADDGRKIVDKMWTTCDMGHL